ncbi:MAG: hypothetical protein N2204_09335 [Anaerolineae bacterium]|nr:hypothetical protein [Anaerolineae bacterium]
MKERLLILLAAATLALGALQPIVNKTAAEAPAPRASQAQWATDIAPDADCQNGGQCSN